MSLELDGGQVDSIYLNLSNAFDKVNYWRLEQKLRMAVFGGNLIQGFDSYLTNRKQRVTVLGVTSIILPVTSGVRQGSVLGPVLFALYVNAHTWSCSLCPVCQIAMFADDTKLFSTIKTENDCKDLQNDLDNLQVWSSVQSHITSNKQVDYQSAKSNKLLGCIRRLILYIHKTAVRRILCLALVRPRLGYATLICSPQSILQIQQIEHTQRRATKFILELSFTSTADNTRLQTLSLLPICYWHGYFDMVLFYKIVNGLVNVKPSLMPTTRSSRPARSSTTTASKFIIPKCKTTTRQRSFFTRTTRVWNLLAE